LKKPLDTKRVSGGHERLNEHETKVKNMNDKPRKGLLDDFRVDPTEHGRDAGSAPAMLRVKLLKAGGKPRARERWAFPYTTLRRVELEDPSTLILMFMGATVTVRGPRMDELFELVAQHKIAAIEVVNQAARQSNKKLGITSVDAAEVEILPDKSS
jgi:hypothetical protein